MIFSSNWEINSTIRTNDIEESCDLGAEDEICESSKNNNRMRSGHEVNSVDHDRE